MARAYTLVPHSQENESNEMSTKHPHGLLHPFRLTIVAFIEDLNQLEHCGLEDPECETVLKCLDAILSQLQRAKTSSIWLAGLATAFSSLRADYFKWNNPRPDDWAPSHRAALCKEIRKHKNGMLFRYSFGPLYATEEEITIFGSVYAEFIRLETIAGVRSNNGPPFKHTVKRARAKRSDVA